MHTTQYIKVSEFCSNHQVEITFIHELHQNGLLELTQEDSGGAESLIPEEQVLTLEKMVRLHYDLEINLEGIAAVLQLLRRVESLQQETLALKNRLGRYEDL